MRKPMTKEKKKEYQRKSYQSTYIKKTEQPGWVETRGRKKNSPNKRPVRTEAMCFSIDRNLVTTLRKLALEKQFNMSEFVSNSLRQWVESQIN
jgi:hypothetical protein